MFGGSLMMNDAHQHASNLTMAKERRFEHDYELSKRLQSGSYGTVYITKRISSSNDDDEEEFAVKVIDRTRFKKPEKDTKAVRREVSVMRELAECSGVICLVDFYETPTTFHVVLELAKGGDLFDKLSQLTQYTEKDARDVAFQFLETIQYMHSRDIIHRDLKPENMLLMDSLDDTTIKLGDFGFARKLPPDGYTYTKCGTPAFVAPKILLDVPYSKTVDMWSVGVILYMLLGGYDPFDAKNEKELFQKIRSADFTFHQLYWSGVSMEAKKLINGLLTVNTAFRFTVEMALESDWITDLDEDDLADIDLTSSLRKIDNFSSKKKLKGFRGAMYAKFWKPDTAVPCEPNKYNLLFSDASAASGASNGSSSPQQSAGSASTSTSTTPRQPFKSVYQLKKKIRRGTTATVWECVHRTTKEVYAVKIINREGLDPTDDEDIMNEVAALHALKHRNIVQLIDFYEDPKHFYMVMELMRGGDVFDRIVARTNYTEKDARDLIYKLLKIINFVHRKGFVHRDLKPENILLKSMDDDADIKLADFGFAQRVHLPQSLTTRCGTPSYVAPEILKNVPHDQAVDMWSIGVITYVLLAGYLPFHGDNRQELFRKIRTGNFQFPEREWAHISPDAKRLVKGLLAVNQKQRLTAEQALKNIWFLRDGDVLSRNELGRVSSSIEDIKVSKKKIKGISGALRWMSLSRTAAPVAVEKLPPPLANKDAELL